jgi:zinc transporter 1/2/3
MDITAQKLLAIVVIWLIGLVAGLWPVLIGARTPHDRFFSLGNALAGGVFLGAGLIHLLPDAIDSYRAVLGPDLDYPLASLVCAAGFLLVLLIEKVLLRGDEAQLAEAASDSGSAFTPYVLALVLSVHSVIAGVALGAESSVATTIALFIAIVAHKGVAAFALGVNLHRAHVARGRSISIVALFAAMTPLGVAVGASLGAALSNESAQWFEGTFDALAAGTFLYIAVVDLVEDEFSKPQDVALKFAMVLLGIAIMALVALWT